MLFEGADGAFCCIAAVHVRGSQLVLHVLLFHVVFEELGGFVVEALELRSVASCGEKIEKFLVTAEDFGCCSVAHGASTALGGVSELDLDSSIDDHENGKEETKMSNLSLCANCESLVCSLE